MNKNFYTSDLHLNHVNITGKRLSSWNGGYRTFDYLEDMNFTILEGINSKVGKNDTLYFLGDFCFGDHTLTPFWRKKILCENIFWIKGNHDNRIYNYKEHFTWVGDVLQTKVENQSIFMSHYKHAVWDKSHHGIWHLYGHCVDIDTEILTNNGWKNYLNISKKDKIFSLKNECLIENSINEIIINENQFKDLYLYNTKTLSMCVTDKHNVLIEKDKKIEAEEFFKKKRERIPLTGKINKKGIDVSDSLLKLYILLAADGSYNEITNLGRLRALKKRKINLFRNTLKILNIQYSEKIQKDFSVCFNFQVPDKLKEYNIKGLDWKLIDCSEKQVDLIVNTYVETDGYLNQGIYPVIFTSKKEETDILQAICSLNNYKSTFLVRNNHGFSKKESYQLSLVKNKLYVEIQPSKFVTKSKPEKNITWCINTEEGNFLCRRKGKVFITGNSHASAESWEIGKSMDVGIDNYFRLYGKYAPFEHNEIKELLDQRLVHKIDHHD